MRSKTPSISLLFVLTAATAVALSGGATEESECMTVLQGVTSCLDFATGKATTPTSQCCKAVSDIRETKPICLCKFIVETHNGSQEIKSLGIQEDQLMKLPSACKLANANVTDCPKLLGVSPNSKTGLIFTSPTSSAPTSSSSSSTSEADSSSGFKHEHGSLLLLNLSHGFIAFSVILAFFIDGF